MNANELLQQALDALETEQDGGPGHHPILCRDIRAHLAAAQPAPVPLTEQQERIARKLVYGKQDGITASPEKHHE